MRSKVYLLGALIVIHVTSCSTRDDRKEARPNIIVIMTDDHSQRALSAYGSKIVNTPNLDRIAKEGVIFKSAFVTNALCGPSRAVMLTGKYSHINGFRDNADTFDNTQPTFPKMLRAAGYYTAVVGKWHLVTEPTGFDYWNIMIDQGHYYNPDFIEMGDTTRRTGYATDLVGDLALERLRERPADKPFCLFMHQKAPHRNWMPNLKHLSMFEKDTIPLPETFYDDYSTRSDAAREQDMRIENMWLSSDLKMRLPEGVKDPGTAGNRKADGVVDWRANYGRMNEEQKAQWDAAYDPLIEEFYRVNPKGRQLLEWKYQRYIKDYLRCVVSVDENVGRVLDYLDENNLAENTIVIYTSDQGFFLGEHGWYDKRFMYEESLSTPFLMRYPARISPGTVNNDIVMNLDIAPTLLDAAGVDIPGDMQGRSLLSLLRGDGEAWRSAMYYHYYEYPHGWHDVKRHYGIRTSRYKLIHFYNDIDEWELYDLESDPNEVNNLYKTPEHAVVVDSLKKELDRLRLEYGDTSSLTH